jgi:hypothetical protein
MTAATACTARLDAVLLASHPDLHETVSVMYRIIKKCFAPCSKLTTNTGPLLGLFKSCALVTALICAHYQWKLKDSFLTAALHSLNAHTRPACPSTTHRPNPSLFLWPTH